MSVRWISCALLAALVPMTPALAEDPPTTADVEITGHIVRPEKIDPAKSDISVLKVPTGFHLERFAEGLINPRILAVGPDGTVYATRRSVGDVVMLKDTDGDGKADIVRTVASRPNMHGIAIDGRKAYLVTIKEIYVTDIASDGSFGPLTRIVDDLPDAGQHADRTIAVGADGMLYVSVGSTCNVCIEDNPENATMLQVKPDGGSRRIIASGLRNTIGFAFRPATGEMYGWDHGIDWLGDNAQPEEMNLIKDGHKYGWPYIYGMGEKNIQHDPPGSITHEEWARASDNPVMIHTAHAAPMQFAFYTGDQFPAEYRGDAFIAFHGSWNRNPPSGYEVLRVHFEDGKPKSLEPFLTGFLTQSADGKYGTSAGPFGVAVGNDGSLFIGDDANGAIYRITYKNAQTAQVTNATDKPSTSAALAEQDTPKELATAILGTEPADIKVTSPAFADGAKMDIRYSAYGENVSPELNWTSGPQARCPMLFCSKIQMHRSRSLSSTGSYTTCRPTRRICAKGCLAHRRSPIRRMHGKDGIPAAQLDTPARGRPTLLRITTIFNSSPSIPSLILSREPVAKRCWTRCKAMFFHGGSLSACFRNRYCRKLGTASWRN